MFCSLPQDGHHTAGSAQALAVRTAELQRSLNKLKEEETELDSFITDARTACKHQRDQGEDSGYPFLVCLLVFSCLPSFGVVFILLWVLFR